MRGSKENKNMRKIFPICYYKCCKGCKYNNLPTSLWDDRHLFWCNRADHNGIGIKSIIPNILYVVDWCKIRKGNKNENN